MTPTTWLKQHHNKYDDGETMARDGAKALGVPAGRVRAAFKKLQATDWWTRRDELGAPPPSKKSIKKRIALSDKDLAARHDPYYQIRVAADGLKRGEYVEDPDFRDDVVKMNPNRYRRPADSPEFDKFKGKVDGITYWGHPDSIKSKKEEGILK